jgi:Streptomyces sporulation and cell division protein, SsgA
MNGAGSDTICTRQELRLVGPGYTVVPMRATLRYRREDPYAVELTLDLVTDERTHWTFSRELLAAALRGPAGAGEVQAWPLAGAGEKLLTITLGAPGHCNRYEASATRVESFLARSYELVPAGQETDCLDLDETVSRLLGQG